MEAGLSALSKRAINWVIDRQGALNRPQTDEDLRWMRAVLWIIGAPPAFPGGLPVLYFLSQARLQELPKRLAGLCGGLRLLHPRPSGKERVCNCEKQGRPSKVHDFSHKSRIRQSRSYFSPTAAQEQTFHQDRKQQAQKECPLPILIP